jgi:tetrapyrrole methylase family protein/MazG family protein
MKKKITIAGLGPGSEENLTLGALKALREGEQIILRTGKHGVTAFLQEQGINYTTLDEYYQSHDSFEEVYENIIKYIIERLEEGDVVLGVPGHPLVGERLVLQLLDHLDPAVYSIRIVPGISRADSLLSVIQKSGPEGLKILMAPEVGENHLDTRLATVILDINSALSASELKLRLLKVYPPELEVYVACQDRDEMPDCTTIPLYELDRLERYDHTTCLYLPPRDLYSLKAFDFYHLVEIMQMLRCPEGCPWDREQTHESLKQYFIEETYEVLEAIDKSDQDKLVEELGDVMLQVVFHAQIAKEHGEFDIGDVTTEICHKMMQRHPHIFSHVKVHNADEVVSNWEAIKKQEKGLESHTQVLKDIPSNLPALMRGYKVQKKAALVGFDWDRVEDAIEKVKEELKELIEAHAEGDSQKITEEMGDLLFAVVNVARFFDIQPELALNATIEKFIKRFEYIEQNADRPLEEMTLEEMDILWNQAKVAFCKPLNV